MKHFHTAISVHDLQKSRAFYETVLELKLKTQGKRPELGIEFISLEDERGSAVELIKHDNPLPLADDPMNFQTVGFKHIAFVVENIEKVLEKAISNGAKVIWPPRKGVVVKRLAFFSDPSGLPVEIVEV